MSDMITLEFLSRQQTQILAEQRMLRGLVEPLPARLSALEARFSALEARIGGIEESLNGIALILRQQSELLANPATVAG
jgi:hypothetical protein